MSDKTQFERSTVATPFFDGKRHGTIDRNIGADVSRGPSGGYVSSDKLKGNLSKLPLPNKP